MIDIEIALTKDQSILNLINGTRKQRVILNTDGLVNGTVVKDLRLGTSYYFRATTWNEKGAESVPGLWSDRLPVECPLGAYCIDNTSIIAYDIVGIDARLVRPQMHYYRLPPDWEPNNLTFVRCFGTTKGKLDTACLGGRDHAEGCKSGYTGLMCGQCVDGWAKSDVIHCNECIKGTILGMALIAGVLCAAFFLGLMVYSVLRSRGDPSLVQTAILKIFLRHAQQTMMAASFPLQWPSAIKDMFSSFQTISSIGDQTLGIECILNSTPPSIGSMFMAKSLIMIYVLPVLIYLSLLAFWYSYAIYEGGGEDPLGISKKKAMRHRRATAVAKLSDRQRKDRELGRNPRSTVNDRARGRIGIKEGEHKTPTNTRIFVSCLVVSTFIHTTMTSMTFRLFKCTKPLGEEGNQRLLLEHDLNIECGSPDHFFWIGTIGIPSLIIYVMGIPAVTFGLLYVYHSQLKVQSVRSMLGFLYSDYKVDWYFWETIIMFRLVIFAAISVLFGDRVDVQAGLGLCTLFGSLYIHLLVQPYVNVLLNKAEEIGLVTSWLTLYGGTLLFSDNITDGYKVLITASVIAVNIGFAVYVIRLMYTESRMYIDRVISRAGSMSKNLLSRFQSARPSRANSSAGDSNEGKADGLTALQSVEMQSVSIRVAGTPGETSAGNGEDTTISFKKNVMFRGKKAVGRAKDKERKDKSKDKKGSEGKGKGGQREHARSTTETLEEVSGKLMSLAADEGVSPGLRASGIERNETALERARARRPSILDTLASAASLLGDALAPVRLPKGSESKAADETGFGIVLEEEEEHDADDRDDGPDWVAVETEDGRYVVKCGKMAKANVVHSTQLHSDASRSDDTFGTTRRTRHRGSSPMTWTYWDEEYL